MSAGRVFLVGAGPGDPGLITVAGAQALAAAEVVVYDRLANPVLLDLAPPAAERIFAGKRPNAHAMSQDEINAALVEHAGLGKTVVRLKGGDPFVFGRGGEETQALAAAGIPFEVIPGISSAIAAPAYAGIPITHRGVAASVAFVTGHEDPTKPESDVDWHKLGTAVDTIVLMMGAGQLAEIVGKLIAAGRDSSTPVALIEWGTLPRQRVVTGTLRDIVAKAEAESIRPPAIAVVGNVVRLRETVRWFDTRPLFGLRVLVTRTREQASELSRALAAAGAEPIELPALKIVPRFDDERFAGAVNALRTGEYAWVCFTSTNAVRIFFDFLSERSLDARAVRAQVAAIGPGTAESLRERGIVPDLVPVGYTAEGLAESFERIDVGGQRVLLPRAENAREVLVESLTQRGVTVDEVTLYAAEVPDAADADGLRRLRAGEIDVATFASSSTVKNLVALLGGDIEPLRRCRIACIGPVTAQAVYQLLGRSTDIMAGEHTIPGLVDVLIDSQLRLREFMAAADRLGVSRSEFEQFVDTARLDGAGMPESLLESWSRTVEECGGDYSLSIEEYENELDARSLIEETLDRRAEAFPNVRRAVHRLDAEFRNQTRDAGRVVWDERRFESNPEKFFFLRRLPAAVGPEMRMGLANRGFQGGV